VFVEQAQAAYQKAGPIIAERDIQRINIELQKAQKAYEQGDYPTAIGKLSAIAKLELQLEQVAQAKKLLDKITQEGTAQLHEAKALADQEKFEEAIPQINEITRKFAGTPVEAAAKDVLSKLMSNPALVQMQKEAEASALLQKAKEAYSAEDYATALQRLQQIANSYPDTSAGSVAQQQLAAMKADEVIMKQIADAKADAKCKSLLSMARSFEMNKDFKRAIECYAKIINEFPASSFAEEARRRKAEAEKLL
jgi:tetratricopeptide (TPR) repeat protein